MRIRSFSALALTTALLTVVLIIIGAVVRVSDSGLGCGDSWPLCNGSIFPPLDNLTAWIEWSHRLVAMLIGVLGIIMLVTAIIHYRTKRRGVLVATVIAAVMYATQAGLGAAVVMNELHPVLVTLHLATAMVLLAGLLTAAMLAVYTPTRRYSRDSFTALAWIAAAFTLVVIFIGAYVRGAGATLACLTWPDCNGALFPFDQGALATIHMIHRFAVVVLGVLLVLLVWSAWSNRSGSGSIRTLSALALLGYLLQAGVGAMVVLSRAAEIWAAGHVGFAAATWAVLVALLVIETSNTSSERLESEWRASEALLN